mmetsp:Transcript_52999/g.137134  ORF Transcript_52999/g.137134 Transcript_52999/m.137134 type:complete len:263 (+) Transcript_52999:624-1412(+)
MRSSSRASMPSSRPPRTRHRSPRGPRPSPRRSVQSRSPDPLDRLCRRRRRRRGRVVCALEVGNSAGAMGGLGLRAATRTGYARPPTSGTQCATRPTTAAITKASTSAASIKAYRNITASMCLPRSPPCSIQHQARPAQEDIALASRHRCGTATWGSSAFSRAPTFASRTSAAPTPSSRQVAAPRAAAAGADWSRARLDSTLFPRRMVGISRSPRARALARLRIEHSPMLSSATAKPTASALAGPSASPSRSRCRVSASLQPS